MCFVRFSSGLAFLLLISFRLSYSLCLCLSLFPLFMVGSVVCCLGDNKHSFAGVLEESPEIFFFLVYFVLSWVLSISSFLFFLSGFSSFQSLFVFVRLLCFSFYLISLFVSVMCFFVSRFVSVLSVCGLSLAFIEPKNALCSVRP